MSKYEKTKYAEGRRAAQRRDAGGTPANPYTIGDGNVSRAAWAWQRGFDAATEAGR